MSNGCGVRVGIKRAVVRARCCPWRVAEQKGLCASHGHETRRVAVCEGSVNELAQGFSIENECLTPTFKLKRPQLLQKYQEAVNAMYTGLCEDVTKQK